MQPTRALAAVALTLSLALLSACAQLGEEETAPEAATPGETAGEPPLDQDYQSCIAACTPQAGAGLPRDPSGVYRQPYASPTTLVPQRRDQKSYPLRAGQAQCLKQCDELRQPLE